MGATLCSRGVSTEVMISHTATILLLRGKLTPASHIISGTTFAKVKKICDETGEALEEALPGAAILVSGWKILPEAGDDVLQGTEADVKRAVSNRRRHAKLETIIADAELINASRRQEREERERLAEEAEQEITQTAKPSSSAPKELRLLIKGDVSGSIEALASAVESIGNKHAVTKVINKGVGEVTESDVMYATAAGGISVPFSQHTC